MKGAAAHWWGFRLAESPFEDMPPSTAVERFGVLYVLASVLGLIWILITGLSFWLHQSWQAVLSLRVIVMIALLAGPFVVGILLPHSWSRFLRLEAAVLMARGHGHLRQLDIIMVVVAVGAVACALVQIRHAIAVPVISMASSAGTAILFLAFSPVPYRTESPDRLRFVPEWLRVQTRDLREPEIAPTRTFEFAVSGRVEVIRVYVPDSTLGALRKLNADAMGCLYQSQPRAVVLLEGAPVNGTSSQEVMIVCTQISRIAAEQGLRGLALANAVLQFVQTAIRYAHDDESMKGIVPDEACREYGRFAIETFYDGVGDCDCTSILCATILTHLGFKVALIFCKVQTPEDPEPVGHVAVGLATNDESVFGDLGIAEDLGFRCSSSLNNSYLYGETALDGSTLPFGVVPDSWRSGLQYSSEDITEIPCKSSQSATPTPLERFRV